VKNHENNSCTHVLQKVGILKNFSVAKVVGAQEITDLKKLIKSITTSKEEYEQMLEQEMLIMSNMHNPKQPIPGIIYNKSESIQKLIELSKAYSDNIKKSSTSKKDLCYIISRIIYELGLTPEDFLKLNVDASETFGDDDEDFDDGDDEDDGDEDGGGPVKGQ
jgi:hypothetical protein